MVTRGKKEIQNTNILLKVLNSKK